MDKQQYNALMGEIDDIVEAVEKFPEHAQAVACARIIDALLGGVAVTPSEPPPRGAVAASQVLSESVSTTGDEPHDLEWYADNFDLETCNDMEFVAFVACYYCDMVPGVKLEAVDKSHVVEACTIVGRDVPDRPGQSLIHAKGRRKYLLAKGAGKYVPSRQGRQYVRDTLLKREDCCHYNSIKSSPPFLTTYAKDSRNTITKSSIILLCRSLSRQN